MKPRPKPRLVAIALSAALLLLLSPTLARAEDGAPTDTKAKIKAKMEKILKLMRANEKALLELSAGSNARTKRVDIDVPPSSGSSGSSSSGSSSGGSAGGANGESASGEITKKLEQLLKSQKSGGAIPGELKELVELIPT